MIDHTPDDGAPDERWVGEGLPAMPDSFMPEFSTQGPDAEAPYARRVGRIPHPSGQGWLELAYVNERPEARAGVDVALRMALWQAHCIALREPMADLSGIGFTHRQGEDA